MVFPSYTRTTAALSRHPAEPKLYSRWQRFALVLAAGTLMAIVTGSTSASAADPESAPPPAEAPLLRDHLARHETRAATEPYLGAMFGTVGSVAVIAELTS